MRLFANIVRSMKRALRPRRRFGAGRRALSAHEIARVLQLQEQHSSQRAIDEETGLNRRTVARIIRDHQEPDQIKRQVERLAYSEVHQQWKKEGPTMVRAALEQIIHLGILEELFQRSKKPQDPPPDPSSSQHDQ